MEMAKTEKGIPYGTPRYYVAYGSNMHLAQMARRCPTAKPVGITELDGYQLTFRGVATIVPKEKAKTPAAVWALTPQDERALDLYEGVSSGLYRKEQITFTLKGKEYSGLIYIMNRDEPSLPSEYYFNVIRQGAGAVGFDTAYLKDALAYTQAELDKFGRGGD